jgi:hypothetical protein
MEKFKEYTQPTKNIWFPEQEEPVYDPNDPISDYQFKEYWKRERDRMKNGFTLAGGKFRVTGWLYWHTVYWKIKQQVVVGERNFPVIDTPVFRDIDLEAAINFERARKENKRIELVGSRGFGKTVWQSSMAAMIYTTLDRSQVIISAGNAADNKTVTDMISMGLIALHPVLQKKRLKNDWKIEIQAGFKTSDGEISPKSSLSQILIKNYQDGNNSMATNGTRPDFHVIDEIGKILRFRQCVDDSDPCWFANSKPGSDGVLRMSALPFFTGTGGDMEVGAEAADLFYEPAGNNILEFDDIWEGKGKIGWFMSVLRAKLAHKVPMSLGKYLGIDHPDLTNIMIHVSDPDMAQKWYDEQLAKAKKSGNPSTLLKFKAYNPIKPSDSFIKLSSNNFDTEACKRQQERIKATGGLPWYVELFQDEGKVNWKFSNKLPITKWPSRNQELNDAPIQIWEHPDPDPAFGLYVAGVDPYKQGQAKYSDSLGAVYVFKRMHNILGEQMYQDMLVACYVARPNNKDDWENQARLLIKYYNARTLVENDEYSFIEYMKAKGDAQYLEKQPAWLREVVPGTQVNREYGIHRSSDRIRAHLHDSLKKYMEALVYRKNDPVTGSMISEKYGVEQILDPMLLEEIIKWNEEDNFDRIVAAELAIALARHLDPIWGKAGNKDDPRFKSYFKRVAQPHQVFTPSTPSNNRRTGYKLFT